ncbi:MAG: PIN domain-containing protein, partial [Desulfamplus sp.]|nr:PIN domain-containing protein [Desulfamplus sp.]
MKYILDTDICVYWLKKDDRIEQNAVSVGLENIAISFMTLSELYYGAQKSQRVDENLSAISLLTAKISVVESNDQICASFGKLKATLEKYGMIIDDADLFIAACALSTEATLVTNNTKH